jgi:hypothetical protein
MAEYFVKPVSPALLLENDCAIYRTFLTDFDIGDIAFALRQLIFPAGTRFDPTTAPQGSGKWQLRTRLFGDVY